MKLFPGLPFSCFSSKPGFLFIFSLFAFSNLFAQAPVANFSATPQNGCSPLIVNFSDLSTGNPTSWQWDLGNGVTSTSRNPSTIYTSPGTYSVILTVTNAGGSNTLTRTNYITVSAPPVPEFTANVTSGCFPLRVQFTDLSDPGFGPITSWSWAFGNGATSTLQNPFYTYTTSGTFFVSLTVTNSAGCTKTIVKPAYINVSQGVVADFNFSTPQNCKPPETISFTNLSSGPPTLTYQWDFGDGNTSTLQNPTNTYATAGPFTVRLITTSSQGCIDTIIKTNIVQLNNFQPIIGSPDSACINAPISMQNLSVPLPPNSRWDFGDATTSTLTNPVKSYTATGTYTIKLVNTFNGCSDSITKTIIIRPRPTAAFNSPDTISCRAPHTVNFQNLSTGAISYQWDFGDGNNSTAVSPAHTYTTTGNFTVRLIATNASGCSDTSTRIAFVRIQRPILNPIIDPAEGCERLNVQFYPNSTSLDSIVSWFWDFGNGNTSTLRNPTNMYDSGSYAVRLRIVTTQGCIDSIRYDSVRVGKKPTAAFSAVPLNVCAFAPVQFTDLSTGNPNQWSWDFGDNNTSSARNPTHTYQDTGLFTIRLIAFNNRCPDTVSITNYIRVLPPIARFRYGVNCAVNKRQVQFTDMSVVPTGWTWNFGDGNTSTAQNPSHTFASLGTYTVTLTVTNGSCTHQLSQTITLVDEAPDFRATPTTICRNQQVQFTGINFNPANIVSYQWDFGDGNSSAAASPAHTYTTSGNYTVSLIIADINGCRDTLTRTNAIRVNGPLASYTILQGQICLSNNVELTNTSTTDGVNAITNVRWDMGNGNVISSLTNPFSYTYPAAGTYNIKLIVTDASGCSDSITRANIVTVLNPRAMFTVDTPACPGTLLQFNNQTTGGSGTQTYAWNFGDGFTSTLTSPTHIYTAVGIYPAKLVVTEPIGCRDSMTINIRIDTPNAAFTVNDTATICEPFEAIFSNQSTFALNASWDFGDGFTSSDINPKHFYVFPGVYRVRLIVQSPGNCFDTAYQTIRIGRDTGTLTYAPLIGCAPLTVNLQTRTDIPLNYTWDFGDGNIIASTDSNRVHIYDAGFYVPKVIIADNRGCFNIIQGIDTIKALGSRPNFGVDTALFCDRGTVQFIDSTIATDVITSYLWDFGDGNTSNSITPPAHTYTSPGLYNVTLTVTTLNGCNNSRTKTALVRVVASPQIEILGDSSYCMPANVILRGNWLNTDTSAMNWRWNIDGQIFNVKDPPAISRPNADTLFAQLIATNGTGCRDTANKIIVVHPLPIVRAGNDTTICLGSFATLNPSGASSYSWSPSTYLSCTNCTNPQAAATDNIQYTVTGTSLYGCVNTDSMIVRVKKPFTITASGGDTICIGRSIQLNASGAENYLWSPGTSLNDSTIARPVASPTSTTTYTVVGYDSLNCFQSTATVTVIVYPYPTVNAGRDTVIRAGSSVLLQPIVSADATQFLWSPPATLSCTTCFNPIATPNATTTYRLIATNIAGCNSFDEVKVIVLCDRNNIFIPNAFTPNGDNLNDRFYVMGPGIENVKSFRIYNRWGNLVFEKTYINANEPLQGWDGMMNGQKAPPGLYSYTTEIICSDGGIIPVSGSVTLIR
ncbi:MAG: PKD domain-containing protein [Chitinophagaceae bacterium]|jgi:gliding motility-associated-like protein|nr:PKD domain-containing protein [Chitinophagaceae bacterium]